ncbi:cobalamin B12-binding domain-containing protein [Candidatus Woesearchaeota archaeon]|nr:cobalamin B12-binding domain-containing protein [Candidatus Woesearchaeota archaeon]
MRVLLIVPPNIGRYVAATIPHAGIAYLSAILKRDGHETGLVDMRMHASNKYLFSKIEEFKPDMIGMTTASIGYKMAYEIIDTIKAKHPKIPIAIGGSYASTVHSKILEDTKIDYVVYGEGERTFLELANGNAISQIKGLIYRDDDEIIMNPPYPLEQDIDKLPFPDYELFELNRMLEKRIPIISSRGCPNRCTFCSIQLVMGHPFRTRSPENVLEELKYWHNKGYDTFEFSDDNFTFNMPRAERICDLIIGSGMKLKVLFGNGLRADRVNEALLKKLKKAGTSWIAYSLESSDPHSLELLKKDLTLEQLKKSVAETKALGIKVQVNFIIGNPGENFEGFLKDLKVAEELNVDQLRFYNMIPYPGTEMYEWVKQNGKFLYQPEEFLNDLNYWGEEPVFETDEFTREERIKAYRLGQEKIMQLFLKRHFGRFLGALGFRLWKMPSIQKHGMNTATKIWVMMKRLRVMQA